VNHLKTYKLFESIDAGDADTEARYQIFGADATIGFYFDRKLITDPDSINDLINVYKKTYSGWSGGPESRDFIDYFNKNYDGSADRKSWYPTINVVIHTPDYGDITVGFGIIDKKYKLTGNNIKSPSTHGSYDNYHNTVISEIGKFILSQIKDTTIDEFIDLLNLNVNIVDWDWNSITESKVSSKLKFKKMPKKKGAKTDVYDVIKDGNVIGQIKWSSRMRGYAFLPENDISDDIKNFVKDLMKKRREEK
jgi:hypothetical protein